MSELEASFLASILESPEDDAPRLIYADWLEEQGKAERAEFIRVQIALTHLTEDSPGRADLEKRERLLLRRHGKEWIARLPAWKGIKWRSFRRGFVEEVEVTNLASFREHAGEMFKVAPIREGLFSQIRPRGARTLAACPELARFTLLHSRGCLYAEGVASLVSSPFIANLRSLLIGMNAVLPAGAEALAASPHLTQLRTLNLYHNGLGDAGAIALAGSPHLAGLRSLDLGSNGIGPAGARALAKSPHLAGLVELNLAHNPLGEEGLRALAEAPGWEELSLLVGGTARLSEAGVAVLRERFGERLRIW